MVKGARGVARSSARGETVRPGWWNCQNTQLFTLATQGGGTPPHPGAVGPPTLTPGGGLGVGRVLIYVTGSASILDARA